ncbi:unnamed protein product [Boreogadus saida]
MLRAGVDLHLRKQKEAATCQAPAPVGPQTLDVAAPHRILWGDKWDSGTNTEPLFSVGCRERLYIHDLGCRDNSQTQMNAGYTLSLYPSLPQSTHSLLSPPKDIQEGQNYYIIMYIHICIYIYIYIYVYIHKKTFCSKKYFTDKYRRGLKRFILPAFFGYILSSISELPLCSVILLTSAGKTDALLQFFFPIWNKGDKASLYHSLSLFHLNKSIIAISSLLYFKVYALHTSNIARYTVHIFFVFVSELSKALLQLSRDRCVSFHKVC